MLYYGINEELNPEKMKGIKRVKRLVEIAVFVENFLKTKKFPTKTWITLHFIPSYPQFPQGLLLFFLKIFFKTEIGIKSGIKWGNYEGTLSLSFSVHF